MKYSVTVKPGSKKGPLVIQQNNDLIVYLRERPVEGKANIALVQLLAEHFNVAKTSIKIKTGTRGRQKIIEIPD